MNNFVKIFSLGKNLYAPGYPVVIEAGALFRNNETGKLHFQLKFLNISDKTVVSLKTTIILMDSMGREIYRAPKQYDDLCAAPNGTFGEKMPVFLKLNTVRQFAVGVEEVCFSDNTLWYAKGDEKVVSMPDPAPLSVKFPSSEASAQFRRTLCMQARFVPFVFEDLWVCSCGTINKNTRKTCSACGADCEKMLAADNDTLKNQYLSYKKEIETRRIYDEASALVEKYDSAEIKRGIALFESISDRVDCRSKIEAARNALNEQIYREASALVEKNDPDSINRGIAVFGSIPDWKDSQAKIAKAKNKLTDLVYLDACALVEKKNEADIQKGIALFESVIGWKDSYDKIEQAKAKLERRHVGKTLPEKEIKKNSDEVAVKKAPAKAKKPLKEKIRSLFAPENRKKLIITASSCALALVLILTSLFAFVVPAVKEQKYLQAQALMLEKKNDEAMKIFRSLNGYKYSDQFILQLNFTEDGDTDYGNAVKRGKFSFWVIPYGRKSIDATFKNCSSLKTVIIPDSVTHIDEQAFYYCANLTSITLPDSVNGSIGTYAFFRCSSLTSIAVPDNVTSIGMSAFAGCSSLKRITLPKKITYIVSSAFYGCSGLKTINYKGTQAQWNRINIMEGNNYLKNAKINYI